MKRFLLLMIVFSSLYSCDITKRALKTKTDTELKSETQEKKDVVTESSKVTETKREGGELTTDILSIEDRPRDENGNFKELIQTLKDGGLTKTIYYRPDGSASVNCEAADILQRIEESMTERDNTISRRMDELDQKITDKESEKEENFDASSLIYGFIGLGILVLMVGGGFMFMLKKQSSMFTQLLQK